MTEPTPQTDMEKFAKSVNRFVAAWAESTTEQFKPFNEAVVRMREQERKCHAGRPSAWVISPTTTRHRHAQKPPLDDK